MPWIRFDEAYRRHRKIRTLDDHLWRVATEAIMWAGDGENLTDGQLEPGDLTYVRPDATEADAAELVARRIWHPASQPCDSEACPPVANHGGWRIHDYFDYQPSKDEVAAERRANADRVKRWRAGRRNGPTSTQPVTDTDAEPLRTDVRAPVRNALRTPARTGVRAPVRNTVGNGVSNAPPTVPSVPSRPYGTDGTDVPSVPPERARGARASAAAAGGGGSGDGREEPTPPRSARPPEPSLESQAAHGDARAAGIAAARKAAAGGRRAPTRGATFGGVEFSDKIDNPNYDPGATTATPPSANGTGHDAPGDDHQ